MKLKSFKSFRSEHTQSIPKLQLVFSKRSVYHIYGFQRAFSFAAFSFSSLSFAVFSSIFFAFAAFAFQNGHLKFCSDRPHFVRTKGDTCSGLDPSLLCLSAGCWPLSHGQESHSVCNWTTATKHCLSNLLNGCYTKHVADVACLSTWYFIAPCRTWRQSNTL